MLIGVEMRAHGMIIRVIINIAFHPPHARTCLTIDNHGTKDFDISHVWTWRESSIGSWADLNSARPDTPNGSQVGTGVTRSESDLGRSG